MSEANSEPIPRAKRPQAPWVIKRRRILKILAVLAVLCLPILIWRISLARETKTVLNGLAAAGKPLTLAQLNAQYPLPADGQNAAEIYAEALRHYVDVPNDRRGDLPLVGRKSDAERGILDEAAREAVAAWLTENGSALEKVHAASARANAQFLAPYAPAGYNDYSVVQQLPELCALVCSAAMFHMDQDNPDAARSALVDAIALAGSLENEGVYPCLLYQWSMESQVIEALQFMLEKVELDDALLQRLSTKFAPEHRLGRIRHMAEVESCLFVARVREGRRRNFMRALFLAAGGGDMNLRAYLGLMADIVDWTEAPLAEQALVEKRFAQKMAEAERRPLLFLTLHVSEPPGNWDFYQHRLDETALAQAGIALFRFHKVNGHYPETLEELVPRFLGGTPLLPSTGAPIPYERGGEGVVLHNGSRGAARQDFTLGAL